jgi:hypothetical protein
MSMRVTADVFQQRDSTRDAYYGGWTFRAKYAYAQYDYIVGTGNALRAVARLGMLQTPIVEHEEQFWPRGLLNTAVELNGFFSSSDMGVSTLVTLPSRLGEVYATVLNGAGYQSRETDRFKDYGGRLTLTPFANGAGSLRTLAITPWFYKGAKASDFARGPGSVLPVGDALQKDRVGLHLGVRDPRLMIGTQLALRVEEFESVADTTTTLVPTRVRRTGSVVSAYSILKPIALLGGPPTSPLNAVIRFDQVKPDRDQPALATFVVAGLGYDLNRRSSLWIDFQNQDPHDGSAAADLKTLFVHAIVNF